MSYVAHVLVLTAIYVVLASSLNLLSGYTGLVSVAQTAIFGLGAYSGALIATRYTPDLFVALAVSGAVGIAISILIAAPSLRVRDDYFMLTTFAFQVIFSSVVTNWVGVTMGPMGIPGIPRPTALGRSLSTQVQLLAVVCLVMALCLSLVRRLVRSPLGRVLIAVREDEVFAQSLGKHVGRYKVGVFVIGGLFTALAGTLYAFYVRFVDPSSFTVGESILVLAMVIIGGNGSVGGPVLGAVMLTLFPEALRFLGLPYSVAANIRQLAYGAALVLFMMFRPAGLLGASALGGRRSLWA